MPAKQGNPAGSHGTVSPEGAAKEMTIHLVFAAKQNTEAPVLVREILKNGWLRRKTA